MALSRSIHRPLGRFAQVGGRRRALVIEAVACLLLARLGLIFLPPRSSRAGSATSCRERSGRARRARQRRTRNYSTCGRGRLGGDALGALCAVQAVCLPQTMAARYAQAARVASVMHFGAAKGDDKLDTHAWLDAAGVEVTGYPMAEKFAEIAASCDALRSTLRVLGNARVLT